MGERNRKARHAVSAPLLVMKCLLLFIVDSPEFEKAAAEPMVRHQTATAPAENCMAISFLFLVLFLLFILWLRAEERGKMKGRDRVSGQERIDGA